MAPAGSVAACKRAGCGPGSLCPHTHRRCFLESPVFQTLNPVPATTLCFSVHRKLVIFLHPRHLPPPSSRQRAGFFCSHTNCGCWSCAASLCPPAPSIPPSCPPPPRIAGAGTLSLSLYRSPRTRHLSAVLHSLRRGRRAAGCPPPPSIPQPPLSPLSFVPLSCAALLLRAHFLSGPPGNLSGGPACVRASSIKHGGPLSQ